MPDANKTFAAGEIISRHQKSLAGPPYSGIKWFANQSLTGTRSQTANPKATR